MKPYKLQALLLQLPFGFGLWRTFYRTRSQDGAMAAATAHQRACVSEGDRGTFRLAYDGRILARWQA